MGVSHLTSRKNSLSNSFDGFSVLSGVGIIVAALITGSLISMYTGTMGWPFLICYLVAVIVVTTLVNPRGLFLVVASAPIFYLIALLVTGGVNIFQQLPPGQNSIGKTGFIVMLYPLVQFFPFLATVTIGTIIIAVVRYLLLRRHNKEITKVTEQRRKEITKSNERTARQATRSRQRSEQVTVQDLLERAPQEQRRSRNSSAGSQSGARRPSSVTRERAIREDDQRRVQGSSRYERGTSTRSTRSTMRDYKPRSTTREYTTRSTVRRLDADSRGSSRISRSRDDRFDRDVD